MWLLTTVGFFSIVEKPDDRPKGTVTVRARVRSDLDSLRAKYIPALGEITASTSTDYRFRAKVAKADLAAGMVKIALDIDYANFKTAVGQRMGPARAKVYGKVWDALYTLQEVEASKPAKSAPGVAGASRGAPKANAFGGVLVDDQGRVLLREPLSHFDGYVWTFPKGKRDAHATPEDTALREVLEETGYRAEIVTRIPGTYRGGTGSTEYFLMRPVGKPAAFDDETAAIRWVTPDEARALIAKTTNARGRERDLAVLKAAVAVMAQVEPGRADVKQTTTRESPARARRGTFRRVGAHHCGEQARLKWRTLPGGLDGRPEALLPAGEKSPSAVAAGRQQQSSA